MRRHWNKEMAAQDVAQKQEEKSRAGEQFKSTWRDQSWWGGGENSPLQVARATLGIPLRPFGIVTLKISFKVSQEVLERKNLAKIM